VTWNGLRYANKLLEKGQVVKVFLMNDGVDLARDANIAPEGMEDLSQMLKGLIKKGVVVKACGTCMARCGIYKNQPYFEGVEKSAMDEFTELTIDCDRIVSF
jgi:uncharacterized protein involved in oxidation of intracellular sulfur